MDATLDPLYSATCNKISRSLKLQRWTDKDVGMAQRYIRKLIYGPYEPFGTVNEPSDRKRIAQREIEREFAITCWLKRALIEGRILPGMELRHYARDYADAQKAHPAPPDWLAS